MPKIMDADMRRVSFYNSSVEFVVNPIWAVLKLALAIDLSLRLGTVRCLCLSERVLEESEMRFPGSFLEWVGIQGCIFPRLIPR